jgi:hypothetical protein
MGNSVPEGLVTSASGLVKAAYCNGEDLEGLQAGRSAK